MRLVINSRGSAADAGLKRYNGEGIYSSIGRKVLLSGLRNVTNTVEKTNRSQLIADAVKNGARRDTVKKARGGKRKSSLASEQLERVKARKYSKSTIDKLINNSVGGSGIILD